MATRLAPLVLGAIAFLSHAAHAESLRVNPEWLRANLNRPDLIVLDARPAHEYEADHIVGAQNLPDSLTYQQKSDSGKIVEPDVMQALLREHGIDHSRLIVVYDARGLVDAARVFWALEVYGLRNVKVLSPGYESWVMEDYPISTERPRVTPSRYVVTVDHRRIASKFSTQLATLNPQQVVVDARLPAAFAGKTSTAKRFGHIPSAINIPVTRHFADVDGYLALRDPESLRETYAQLAPDSRVILYCETGRASSTSYLALRELGYDVANYDASWREWGNDLTLPIEN